MKSRLGSTRSPISVENTRSASKASSTRTCSSVRLRRIHRCLPKLLGIHLPQALVALDLQTLLP
jgi:Tfp pilus assembly ATPase PilU